MNRRLAILIALACGTAALGCVSASAATTPQQRDHRTKQEREQQQRPVAAPHVSRVAHGSSSAPIVAQDGVTSSSAAGASTAAKPKGKAKGHGNLITAEPIDPKDCHERTEP